MRNYYMWCPNGVAPEPPPVADQVSSSGMASWSPRNGLCLFASRSGQQVEIVRWHTVSRLVRVGQSMFLPNSQWHDGQRPEQVVAALQENYRCQSHSNPPEIFRTQTAVENRITRLIGSAYDMARVGEAMGPEESTVPWPDHVDQRWHYRHPLVYLPRLEGMTTHRLWN